MTKPEPTTHRTLSGKVVPDAPPSDYSLAILGGLQHKQPVFAGIVTHAVGQHPTKPLARNLARRRAANKCARVARRAAR